MSLDLSKAYELLDRKKQYDATGQRATDTDQIYSGLGGYGDTFKNFNTDQLNTYLSTYKNANTPTTVNTPKQPVAAGVGQQPYSQFAGFDWNQYVKDNQAILNAKNDPTQWGSSQVQGYRDKYTAMGLPVVGNVGLDEANQQYQDIVGKANQYSQLPTVSSTDSMMKQFQEMMNQMTGQNTDFMKQLQDQANKQAGAITTTQKNSLQTLIDSLKNQQTTGMTGINNGVQDSQSALEDKTFQNYLSARQGMANRGLAGSGLASDQDTRLLLQKNKDLAGIYRDASKNKFALESDIGNKLDSAYNQVAAINPDQTASGIFQQLYKDGRANMSDNAKLYADMLSKIIGYDMPNADTKLKVGQDQNKLGQDADQFKQKMALDWAKFYGTGPDGNPGMDMQKMLTDSKMKVYELFGTDENGRPTLNMQKLNETIRHDKVGEAQNGQQMLDKMNYQMALVDLKKSTFKQAQWDKETQQMYNGVKSQMDLVNQLRQSLDKNPNNAALKTQLEGAINSYEKLRDAFLVKGNNATAGTTTSTNTGSPGSGNDYSEGQIPMGNNSDLSYTNLWKTNRESGNAAGFGQFQQLLGQAMQQAGVDSGWAPYLTELFGRESTWDPNAANPDSTARGYAQFLDSTRSDYKDRYGLNYDDSPLNQLVLGIHYTKDRYGDPVSALNFWDKNNWY